MAYSVNVAIEAPIENQIQEIAYDGTEVYQQPLSMSESLSKLAAKIDFGKGQDEKEEKVVDKTEEDAKDPAAYQSSLWPWDSVRNKLKNAFTEVCVLSDVLAIAKEKRYLVLDPVPQEPPETKAMVTVYARKKALGGAATVLLTGAERLRTSQSEAARNRAASDFHIELLALRKNWRLKKVGNSIIGDVSYRTAGSKFASSGMFEVTKAEEEPSSGWSPPQSPSAVAPPPKTPSALRVTLPSELQGVAYIEVHCRKDDEALFSTTVTSSTLNTAGPMPDMHWQKKLEAAQNVLFCKELFNQLAKEAVQLPGPIPHMVVGNQIVASILPGIQLIIGLCHSTATKNKKSGPPQQKKSDHDHVLEHSIHQLLREVHHKNTHHPFPHPSSGPLGPSKQRCLAGPSAVDRHELMEMSKSKTLLEQIIEQTQHFTMRRRTEYVLDTIAKEVRDPLIISHWNSINSPTKACVKVNIMTHGYDTICRTLLIIHVGKKSLKCICRDGSVMNMSYEIQELRDLLICQIQQHQITAVQALAKCMGWQLLSNNTHLGVGEVQQMGNASSCMLASPMGDRLIAVRCEPQAGVHVSIAHSPRKDFYPGQLVKDRKWENLGGGFKEVRWDKMEGKNFLNKMELLMASLTSSS
ncbi:hypothetical protein FOCC_FOCC004867 [Frankliniella occidentalis]|uniref:Mediator of RNA polymerase II transcription subunit 17 n=1 Tax=Frankliniella occidentalis TaxID=133901 RepID=A0A9C6WN25_FRAOC|nr:mediator of RNA polymerase II transcription subunit 17 [Frankliniella occidentalis]KAE8748436.1 hypothetical protein FOCC_FOCC004867 [Frankliniella occidentalis]